MLKVFIVYATLGGNTELAVKRVEEEMHGKAFEVKIKRVDTTVIEDLNGFNLIILASPTYGQGTVEQHFEPFLKKLKSLELSQLKYSFAVIGLGDTKYYPEYLTESASVLENTVTKAGGKLVVPSLRIGMPPLKFINKLVPGWVAKIEEYFKNLEN